MYYNKVLSLFTDNLSCRVFLYMCTWRSLEKLFIQLKNKQTNKLVKCEFVMLTYFFFFLLLCFFFFWSSLFFYYLHKLHSHSIHRETLVIWIMGFSCATCDEKFQRRKKAHEVRQLLKLRLNNWTQDRQLNPGRQRHSRNQTKRNISLEK